MVPAENSLRTLLYWSFRLTEIFERNEEKNILNNTWQTIDSCGKIYDILHKFNTLAVSHEIYFPISYIMALNYLK